MHHAFQYLQYHYLKSIENKHDIYRGKDCMKNFCESLKKQAVKKINSKKKTMKLLTDHMKTQKSVEFGKKNLKISIWKTKKCIKF